MRIAIDFDGTIANTNLLKQQFALSKFGVRVPLSQCDKTSFSKRFGLDMYRQVTEAVYNRNCTFVTPVIPGAATAVRTLSKKHELVLLSARPRERLGWAEEWLKSRGMIGYFLLLCSSHGSTKVDVAAEHGCAVLIDDDLRHRVSGGKQCDFVLFKYSEKTSSLDHSGLLIARSWGEVVAIIDSLC